MFTLVLGGNPDDDLSGAERLASRALEEACDSLCSSPYDRGKLASGWELTKLGRH